MIAISRKVEEPNNFFGSTGWRLPEIVTPLCWKPQTTVTTATHASCHPGPSLWHSEHAYKGLPQGKLLPPKHEAMFIPNPRGSGKVWMMLTSEYTFIIIYYVNQTWVNREGFSWGFQQGKIQLMSMCILWAMDEKPCSQLQNGLYLRNLKGQTRHILIWPSNFSCHWMWSIKT